MTQNTQNLSIGALVAVPRHLRRPTASWVAALSVGVLLLLAASCDDTPQGSPPNDPSPDTNTPADTSADTSEGLCGERLCVAGEVCCEGLCIDPTQDPNHCGGCAITCAPDETCAEGRCTCGAALCEPHERCCDATGAPVCLDVLNDPLNCGACGTVCEDREACLGGRCACSNGRAYEICATEETCCSGIGCINPQTDPLHCGGCRKMCNAGERCDDGQCACGDILPGPQGGTACLWGQICCDTPPACYSPLDPTCQCGTDFCGPSQSCCDNACANTYRDTHNCGACGATCAQGQLCERGACTCEPGREDCDNNPQNGCEANLRFDPRHCGGCGVSCPDGEVCDGLGLCALSCQAGLEVCNSACVSLYTDRLHCGTCDTACPPGEVCDGLGLCALSCQVGFTQCDGVCVDTLADRLHCGGCGQGCFSGEVCDGSGRCAPTCQPGLATCGQACVDLQTDPRHCGACDAPCGQGLVCDHSQCVPSCPATFDVCGLRCEDTQNDRNHCGGCGIACAPGETCDAGRCLVICPPNLVACDGLCVDPTSDPLHCGDCDHACDAGSQCINSACALCPPTLAECTGICVDTQQDGRHCGGCDQACGANERCVDGLCECRDSLLRCDGLCVDPLASSLHCAGCNQPCPTGLRCNATAQGPTATCGCPPNATLCTNICVDTQASFNHCGQCDNPCDPGTQCSGGACVAPFVGLAAGAHHTCALGADGAARCWGSNSSGQAGAPPNPWRLEAPPVAAPLTPGGAPDAFAMLAAGGDTTCAITQGGFVYCWGANDRGQLGNNDPSNAPQHTPQRIVLSDGTPLTGATAITVSGDHVCAAINNGGQVACWGGGSTGELGDACEVGLSCTDRPYASLVAISWNGIGETRLVAALVSGASRYTPRPNSDEPLGQQTRTHGFTCALLAPSAAGPGGEVWCWGVRHLNETDLYLINTFADDLASDLSCQGCASQTEPCGAAIPVRVAQTDNACNAIAVPRFDLIAAGPSGLCARQVSELDNPALTCSSTNTNPTLTCWGFVTRAREENCGCSQSDPNYCGFTRPLIDSTGGAAPLGALSLGAGHVCALHGDTVRCEGDNSFLQAHPSPSAPSVVENANFTLDTIVPDLPTALVDIAAGQHHTCALSGDGKVRCWGLNGLAQTGRPIDNTPQPVALPAPATQIASAGGRTCALLAPSGPGGQGEVWCWGLVYNPDEARGAVLAYDALHGSLTPEALDTSAVTDTGAISGLSLGQTHGCLLTDQAEVWCWGRKREGQLQDPSYLVGSLYAPAPAVQARRSPGNIVLSDVTALTSGALHACAISAGSLVCWGDNSAFQLSPFLPRPTYFGDVVLNGSAPTGAVTSAAAGRRHTCALTANDRTLCWGSSDKGQIGQPDPTEGWLLGLPTGLTQLVAGDDHTCAITQDGKLWCWGANDYGQLGDGSKVSRAAPAQVMALDAVTVIAAAAGPSHTCALTDQAQVWCWGAGLDGALAGCTPDNAQCEDSTLPVLVPGIERVIAISAAGLARDRAGQPPSSHTCAILRPDAEPTATSGSVWCWGSNAHGQLGQPHVLTQIPSIAP